MLIRDLFHGWLAVATVACGPQADPVAGPGSGSADGGTEGDSTLGTGGDSTLGTGAADSTTGTGPNGEDDGCQWTVQIVVESTAIPDPFWGQVAAGTEGPVLARQGLQVYPLYAFDYSGAIRWSREIDDLELVRDLWVLDDGTTLVTGDVTGGAGVWLGLLEVSGEVRWSTVFDDGGGLWAVGYVVPAPEDEIFVAYENDVETSVSRRDAEGNELWVASIPRPGGVTGQHHAIAAMPSGDVLQLHRAEGSSLIHRSGEDGSVLSQGSLDFRVDDLTVLPDGTVFVAGSDDALDAAILREVEPNGDTIAAYTYEHEAFVRIAWDDQTERLYVGGSMQEPGEALTPLRKIVDRDGAVRFDASDPPETGAVVLDVAPLPAGGFVETRLGEPEVLTITCE